MNKMIIILLGAFCLLFVSCGGNRKQPEPPPVIVQAPDYKPIGEGMKVHSYAIIGVAVIIAVALMSRGKND